MSKLAVISGDAHTIFHLNTGENIIGRCESDPAASLAATEPKGPEVNLDSLDTESKISRRHAMIELDSNKLLLTDLGSTNGTYLFNPIDGTQTKVEPGRKYPLRIGDKFSIGKLILQIIE